MLGSDIEPREFDRWEVEKEEKREFIVVRVGVVSGLELKLSGRLECEALGACMRPAASVNRVTR